MLLNAPSDALTVQQIAHHLSTRDWNVTRQLQLGEQGLPGRLKGYKISGPGIRGRNGQWRVDREVYLDWLQIPAGDRQDLNERGLPILYTEEQAAEILSTPLLTVHHALLRLPLTHVMVGWRRYLTHRQLEQLRWRLTDERGS